MAEPGAVTYCYCDVCGGSFAARDARVRYCSKECKKEGLAKINARNRRLLIEKENYAKSKMLGDK